MEKLKLQREVNLKRQELKKMEKNLFFCEMELDTELEARLKGMSGEFTAKVVRQFVVEVGNFL